MHVVQIKHTLIQRIGLTCIRDMERRQLRAAYGVRPIGPQRPGARTAELAQDGADLGRWRIEAARGLPAHPLLTQRIQILLLFAVFSWGFIGLREAAARRRASVSVW